MYRCVRHNSLLQHLLCPVLIYILFQYLTFLFIINITIIKSNFLVWIPAGPSSFLTIFLHSAVQWFCNTSLFTRTAMARTDAKGKGNLRDAILTVVLFTDQVNVCIFTVNAKKYLELCMVTSLQDGRFNFLEGQESFLQIPVFPECYTLPSQVIIRWVRIFCQGQTATNYHLE